MPSYAAAAWYHGKAKTETGSLHDLLQEVRDRRHKAPGIDEPLQLPNVALDLSAAMRRNPNLRVYLMGGVYDLAGFYAQEPRQP